MIAFLVVGDNLTAGRYESGEISWVFQQLWYTWQGLHGCLILPSFMCPAVKSSWRSNPPGGQIRPAVKPSRWPNRPGGQTVLVVKSARRSNRRAKNTKPYRAADVRPTAFAFLARTFTSGRVLSGRAWSGRAGPSTSRPPTSVNPVHPRSQNTHGPDNPSPPSHYPF